MTLDTDRLNILYHALGHNVSQGLVAFDAEFRDAEASYSLDDAETLLGVIDRTLQDPRLVQWRHYYEAKAALMLWQVEEALLHLEQVKEALLHLEAIPKPDKKEKDDLKRLTPRKHLLDGQIKLMQGQWAAGRNSLKSAISGFKAGKEPALLADAYEYVAQSFLMLAQEVGSWAEARTTRSAQFGRWLAFVSLLPLLGAVFLLLWIGYSRAFFRPAVQFAADLTNWPVFRYYLGAHRALRKARRLAARHDLDRAFRLDLTRAGLLRSLTAYRAAHRDYARLDKTWKEEDGAYQRALIDHGWAGTLLEMQAAGRSQVAADAPAAAFLLDRARAIYERYRVDRSVAHVDLLRGDLALAENRVDTALDLWAASIATTEAKQEPVGLADGLARCYQLLETRPAPEIGKKLRQILDSVDTKAFSARLTNSLFRALQFAVWLAPLVIVLVGVLVLGIWLRAHERADYRYLARLVISWRGLAGAAAAAGLVMIVNSALAFIGLLSTLFAPATRLDTFLVGVQQLQQVDARGREVTSIAWRDVAVYLRVQRAVWNKPTESLSFECLRPEAGESITIPATTRWFEHLQQELEEQIDRRPQIFSLQAHAGLALVYLGLAFPVTFAIIDLAFYPILSVDAHAILAAVYMLLSFLGVVYATQGWIAHYLRVYRLTASRVWFAVGGGLVGLSLLVVSFVFRRALYPLMALPTAWGIGVLFVWIGEMARSRPAQRARRLGRIGQAAVLLCGLLLLWLQIAPTLLHLAAFTYSGAIEKLDAAQPDQAADRQLAFQRLATASRGMLTLDRSLTVAHGLLGVAEHGLGNYDAAVSSYTEYLKHTHSVDLYDCRALSYLALGKQDQAAADFTVYGLPCDSTQEHFCDTYFPGERARLCQP